MIPYSFSTKITASVRCGMEACGTDENFFWMQPSDNKGLLIYKSAMVILKFSLMNCYKS